MFECRSTLGVSDLLYVTRTSGRRSFPLVLKKLARMMEIWEEKDSGNVRYGGILVGMCFLMYLTGRSSLEL